MTSNATPFAGTQLHRRVAFDTRAEGDATTFPATLSTEAPVRRWFGREVLDHSAGAVDLKRAKANGLSLLLNHDPNQIIGRVERIRSDGDRLRGVLRFFDTPAGREARAMAEQGLREVSIGYAATDASLEERSEDEGDLWRVTRWELLEASLVAVPADPAAGIGRAHPLTTSNHLGERTTMTTETTERPSRAERRAQAAERNEAAEITDLCRYHGFAELAGDFIRRGLTADQAGREILQRKADAQRATMPTSSARPADGAQMRSGMDELPRGYSLAAAILAAHEGKNCMEREYGDDVARRLGLSARAAGSVFVPAAIFARTLDTKTPNYGAELVAGQPVDLIGLLRNSARVIQSGARVLAGLQGNVPFPKQVGAASAYWGAENPAADVPASDPKFGSVTLAPKTLMAYVSYARQLLVQASVQVEAMVRGELAAVHGIAIDRAALHGTGADSEPLGIYQTPDVLTEAMGGVPDYVKLTSMSAKVADANALVDGGSFGYLTTPLMAGKLKTIQEFATSGAAPIWTGTYDEGAVAGFRARATSNLSKTMSTLAATGGSQHGIVFGNWADLMIGLWGVVEMIVDPYTQARKGLIGVTSFQMADVAVRHGESFCVSTGATLT